MNDAFQPANREKATSRRRVPFQEVVGTRSDADPWIQIILASNRRVDVTLNTTGQKSVRQFPFNAADSLTLIKQEGPKKTTAPAARKKAKSVAKP